MAINFPKHVRRLVNRRDRLAREIRSKQRDLDAVLKQLASIQAALPAALPTGELAPSAAVLEFKSVGGAQ
jgi:hypothetical protein